VTKPCGYRRVAEEQLFVLLVLALPYCQSLLLAGMSGMISVLLMACLLIFVAVRSSELIHTLTALASAIPLGWLTPPFERMERWVSVPSQALMQKPDLALLFQRPPPIFS